MDFKITSNILSQLADQPQAIRQLTEGMFEETLHRCLLGVTGLG